MATQVTPDMIAGALTIRSSRLRFVPAKQWQKELATVLPPLRYAA